MGVLVGDYAVLSHKSMIGTRNIGQYSVNGMLSVSCADPYWGNIFARQGDDWKILMDTSNTTPAPSCDAVSDGQPQQPNPHPVTD
jgi:hypothetical protein